MALAFSLVDTWDDGKRIHVSGTIAATGNYDRAFVLAGLLMLLGAACCLALARNEIQSGSAPLVRNA